MPAHQECVLPDDAHYKLRKFWGWKQRAGELLLPAAPLFISRFRKRLSARRYRSLFRDWQERAGFERVFTVHELRHTALTKLFRSSKNLRLVQRVARHVDMRTTQIYAHVSDDELLAEVRKQD